MLCLSQNVMLVCYLVHLEVIVRNFNNRDSMDANSEWCENWLWNVILCIAFIHKTEFSWNSPYALQISYNKN